MDDDNLAVHLETDADWEEAVELHKAGLISSLKILGVFKPQFTRSLSQKVGDHSTPPQSTLMPRMASSSSLSRVASENGMQSQYARAVLSDLTTAHQRVASSVIDWFLRKMPAAYFRYFCCLWGCQQKANWTKRRA
jgi:hypothetical protein